MFTLLFRKMRNTKWMVLCLLIGFVMASAMMSTIPIYMNASLQRMLVKDLESFQTEYEIYPGAYNTSYGLKMDISGSEQQKAVENYNNKVEAKFKELGLPEKLDKKYISDEYLYVCSLAVSDGNSQARFTLGGMTDISDHISIKQGRMFTAGKRSDGVYECVATEKAMKSTELAIDTVYEIADVFDDNKSIKIEIVGVFDVKDENDAYWAEGLDSQYTAVVFTDYDTMLGDCVDTGVVNITKAVHNYAVDYASMNMTDLASTNEMIAKQKTYFGENSIKNKDFGDEILSNALFTQFMVYVNRIFLQTSAVPDRRSYSSDSQVEQLLKYINRNLTEDLSIDRLSEKFFFSKYHMMRKFKNETGYTIHNYITSKRLLLARSLINEGTPVMKAAQMSGFNDYTTFVRSYKKQFGNAPSHV